MQKKQSGIGKRKTAVAKAFLKEGSGNITINEKTFERAFSGVFQEEEKIKIPLVLLELEEKYDITIYVKGGGITAQIEAIRLAIAKALCKENIEYRQKLSKQFLLRRDSRIKERKKYGLKKARKASQYSKR